MATASRVLLPVSEPNWHGPATFATAGTSGRSFCPCLANVAEQSDVSPIPRIPNVFSWFWVRKQSPRLCPLANTACGCSLPNTLQWQDGSIGTCPTWSRKERRRWPCAAWLWEWWQQKHVGARLPNRWRAAFHGLELTTPLMCKACRLNTQSESKDSPTLSWVVPKNSPEQTTDCMFCRKRKVWRTCGTRTTVTSCVTRSWCRLTCMNSTSPVVFEESVKLQFTQKHQNKSKQTALRGQAGTARSLLAAKMLSVDWREKRCRHRRLVWLCLSLSLRDRGPIPPVERRDTTPMMQSSINGAGEEPLCPC